MLRINVTGTGKYYLHPESSIPIRYHLASNVVLVAECDSLPDCRPDCRPEIQREHRSCIISGCLNSGAMSSRDHFESRPRTFIAHRRNNCSWCVWFWSIAFSSCAPFPDRRKADQVADPNDSSSFCDYSSWLLPRRDISSARIWDRRKFAFPRYPALQLPFHCPAVSPSSPLQ